MSLKLYKPLTSNIEKVRLDAASQLTRELLAWVESEPTNNITSTSTTTTTEENAEDAPPTTETTAEAVVVIEQRPTIPGLKPGKDTKTELTYALTRLIKGLASGHESARFGFAVVLTELLSSLLTTPAQRKWGFTVETVLGLVSKWMEVSEHTTKSEERDRWLGKLFGLKSILMAPGLYTLEKGEAMREREFRTVVGEVLKLGGEKSWLREPAVWALVAAAREFGWGRESIAIVWKLVVEGGWEREIEAVGLWLVFEGLVPGVMAEVGGKAWEGKGGPLGVANLTALAKALKESGGASIAAAAAEKKEGAKKELGSKGVWSAKLHWVWDEILRVYMVKDATSGGNSVAAVTETPAAAEKKSKKKDKKEKKSKDVAQPTAAATTSGEFGDIAPFADFWRVVVDESLFSASSSEERKFHGFLLIIKLLTILTAAPQHIPFFLPHIFTRNLLRCMINHLSDESRYLHKSAQKTIKTIQHLAQTHPAESIPTIVRGLVLGNGTTGFDHLTKTKTVEKLLPLAGESEAAMSAIVAMFVDIIIAPPVTTQTAEDADDEEVDENGEEIVTKKAKKEEDVKRQWAADQLLSIIRSGKVVKHVSWTGAVVDTFSLLGHVEILGANNIETLYSRVPTPKVSDASREMFRARLASVLGHLISVKQDDEAAATTTTAESWPYRAIKMLVTAIDSYGVKLAMEFDESIAKAVKLGWKRLDSIHEKYTACIKAGQAVSSPEVSQLQAFELLYSLVLLQVYNGDSDAVELLGELELCYSKILKKSKAVKGEAEVQDSGAVLVEILLSFLSKPSVLLRKLAGIVWSSLATTVVSNEGLEAMLDVLDTKESLSGQSELFEEDDGDDEEDDEDDVEFDGTGGDVNMDNEEEEGEQDVMDVDEEYKDSKIPKVAEDSDAESGSGSDDEVDAEEDDEEEDAPTDDETAKFEAALGKALQTQKPTAAGSKAAVDSDSDADMTDSEMMPLDAALSIMFRERMKKIAKNGKGRSKKKQAKDAKENIVVFKGKVVELLEMWVKAASPSSSSSSSAKDAVSSTPTGSATPLFITIVLPRLIKAIRISTKPQLREKISALVRLGCKLSFPATTSIPQQSLWTTLTTIHTELLNPSANAAGPVYLKACSAGSLFVVRALVHSTITTKDGESDLELDQVLQRISTIYGQTMGNWLVATKEQKIGAEHSSFFGEFVAWGGGGGVARVLGTTVAGKKAVSEEEEGKKAGGGDKKNKKNNNKQKAKEVVGGDKKKNEKKDKDGGKKGGKKDLDLTNPLEKKVAATTGAAENSKGKKDQKKDERKDKRKEEKKAKKEATAGSKRELVVSGGGDGGRKVARK